MARPDPGRAGSRPEGRRVANPDGALGDRFDVVLEGRPELLPRGSTVLVAYSGGPDSTALLHLLMRRSGARDLRLHAAHFDHRQRPGSAREADRVRRWAGAMGVACRVGVLEEEGSGTSPEAMRRARYRFLRRAAAAVGADRIATGHQADDQIETVLFRLLRGTGLRGLAGIPVRRGPLVRPLLTVSRGEIEDYVEAHGLPALADPANRDRGYARARVRHQLLPALESRWEGPVRDRLLRVARLAGEVDAAQERLSDLVLDECRTSGREDAAVPAVSGGAADAPGTRLSRPRLRGAGREMQARVVRKVARHRGVRLSEGGTRAAVQFISEGRSGGHVDLGEGLRLVREFDSLWIGAPEPRPEDEPLAVCGAEGEGTLRLGGRRFEAAWGSESASRSYAFQLALPICARQLFLTFRGREPGDQIRLPRGTRKLKELFVERRVPLSERSRIPLLATGEGEVLWAVGLAVDERIAEADDMEEIWWVGLRHV